MSAIAMVVVDAVMTAYEQLSTLERERVDHEAPETLYAVFLAAHCATGWCGDVERECWSAGLPVMREAMAKLILSYRGELGQVREILGDREDEITRLRAELEEEEKGVFAAMIMLKEARGLMSKAEAEIEQMQELLRGVGANRYWESRWRDSEAENKRLRAEVEGSNDNR